MKRILLISHALAVVGLLAFAANASAALSYFDAQIVDITSGKTVIPKNTTWANGTLFTPLPFGPGTEGPPATTQTDGNWSQNGTGAVPPNPPGDNNSNDNAWRQRFSGAAGTPGNFGNVDASNTGTIYESRGVSGGTTNNRENAPALKTTINTSALAGQNKSVWVLFWSDGSPWQISASLTNADDDTAPRYVGGSSQTPSGYVLEVFDAGETFANLAANYPLAPGTSATALLMDTAANYTSSDAGWSNNPTTPPTSTGRHLWAGFLGDEVLGAALDVYVGDGRPLNATELTNNGGANHRTWYDGIALGDPTGLARLPDLPAVPEPASAVLLGLGLVGFGGLIRRRVR